MLRNYFTIALRTLWRRRGYAAINVVGLALGLACCLLIGVYVHHELSYEQHHEHVDRIYRVTAVERETGKQWAPIGPPVGAAIAEAMPEVEGVTRFFDPWKQGATLTVGEQTFVESAVLYADSTVFEVFTMPLVRGNPRTALAQPNTVVLTETLAQKYFGAANPMGETLLIDGHIETTVTGIMDDPPSTTHLPVGVFVSMATFAQERDWLDDARSWAGFYTYVLLREDADAQAAENRFPAFIDRFFPEERGQAASTLRAMTLQPLADIHLRSSMEKELRPNSSIAYVYLFIVVAGLVLVAACINFINLATAQAAERAKEVGVRKTLGARRNRLAMQFLGETAILAGAGMGLAWGLAYAAQPLFRSVTGIDASLYAFAVQPEVLLVLVTSFAVVSLGSGSYPAFVLSGFQPTRVLRGRVQGTRGGAALRKGLIVMQFALSVALIIGTGVVRKQLDFLSEKSLGLDKEHVMVVPLMGLGGWEVYQNADAFEDRLKQHAAIKEVSFASDVPSHRYGMEEVYVERDPDQTLRAVRVVDGADENYFDALGANIVAGRSFDPDASGDEQGAFVINEAAAQVLALDRPVGARLVWGNYEGTVVGVVENFHFASLHHRVEPLIVPLRPEVGANFMLVRAQPGRVADALDAVQDAWAQTTSGGLFNATFLDQSFERLYRSEARMRTLFDAFAALSVLIACLGLFGLAAYTAEQRRRELGIRKAMGASVRSLVVLLTREFALLVGGAFVVAAPLAYWGLTQWLTNFAYRTEVSFAVLAVAGGLVFTVALLTVGYQSIRAARVDPAKVLRTE